MPVAVEKVHPHFSEISIFRLAAFQAPGRRKIWESNPLDLSVPAYTPPEPE